MEKVQKPSTAGSANMRRLGTAASLTGTRRPRFNLISDEPFKIKNVIRQSHDTSVRQSLPSSNGAMKSAMDKLTQGA